MPPKKSNVLNTSTVDGVPFTVSKDPKGGTAFIQFGVHPVRVSFRRNELADAKQDEEQIQNHDKWELVKKNWQSKSSGATSDNEAAAGETPAADCSTV